MPALQDRSTRLFKACTLTCGAAALVCGVVFCLAPKHGIAVVAALCGMGCVVLSVIASVLGIVAFILRNRRKS